MKPSKEDVQMCKDFIRQTSNSEEESPPFQISKAGFIQIIKAFVEHIDVPSGGPLQQFLHKNIPQMPTQNQEKMNQKQIDTIWKLLDTEQRGYLSIT